MEPNNRIVRINVGGTVYKCYVTTLAAFPESRLAKLEEETDAFYAEENEYFFDRNPHMFAYILDSIRNGAVHVPQDVCGTSFRKELEFWDISPCYVAPCCLEALYCSEDDIATEKALTATFHQNLVKPEERQNFGTKIWLFLDVPSSSKYALVWSIFVSLVILASTLADSLATLDAFQENFTASQIRTLYKVAEPLNFDNAILDKFATSKPQNNIIYLNVFCHTILTTELIVCFIVCKNKKDFVSDMTRLTASFGYFSYWIACTFYFSTKIIESVHVFYVQVAFQYLSIFKLARLFYMARCIPAFRLICLTFRSSKQELKMFVFLLATLVCVFGYILFAAEVFQNSKITNIFISSYWALITLTTVGYGNYIPYTPAGHVIAGACAVCGLVVLALPVGIIVSKFYKYYTFHEYKSIHTIGAAQSKG